ncbi:hypothetical protein LTR70_005194 [Exophiala xenobiotica]|uniref:Cytochrome b561 domain-containing protein n=1 Tax=Lithohypha guttulata TaxID=1690604 RepID=A0ABR0KB17_9EURO|nr:hypothetical protein LTR24_004737 [Lithohypha guttulata]KAK5318898.1 hypothetical protein LTR70_005194 [Exophiala xenobiotica]
MGLSSYLTGIAVLATAATAQVATYSNNNEAFSVNIPSDTASAGSGPIYFQISAPSGTQWVSFGQGNRMSGSNMFVVYAQDSTNVTLSPRLGTGHSMPRYNSDAQVTLLDGSGIASDGSMVANVRCDNCESWSGGSMDFTDSSSSWIHASRSGDAMDTDDASASIQQHNTDTTFSLDLTSGTGGSSSNPFVAQADEPPASETAAATGVSSTASQTGSVSQTSGTASTATSGVSNPLASSGSDTTSSGNSGTSASERTGGDNTQMLLSAHGIIMSVLFLALFPLAALTLYLPTTKKVRFIHAPLQVLGTILLIVGMSLGIVLGNRIGEIDGYHQSIGFFVVAMLVLFQPAMGLYQHLHYHKTGGRTIFGVMHRWLGRSMIILGIVNGGLGWHLTHNAGAYTPYAVVAAIVFLIYISVLVFAWYKSRKSGDLEDEKALRQRRGYEMQQPKEAKHRRLGSDPANAYEHQQQSNSRRGSHTISSRR